MTQKWKVLLAFAGIFVAGAIAGGVVALRVEKERAYAAAAEKERAARDKDAGNISPQLMKTLTGQLSLAKPQQEQIQPIIDQTAEKIAALNQDYREATQEYREETMKLREEMEQEVSALLNAEQLKKLADGQATRKVQFDARFTNNRRGGGPGNPGLGGGRGGDSNGDRRGGFRGGSQSASSPFRPGSPNGPPRGQQRRGGPPGAPVSNSSPAPATPGPLPQ